MVIDSEVKKYQLDFGMLSEETEFEFLSNSDQLRVKNKSNKLKTIFRPDFKFEDMGVGGLDQEI